MQRLLLLLSLLFALPALGADRVIINPDQDGDLVFRVNDGGAVTDALVITGSTGAVSKLSVPDSALGGSATSGTQLVKAGTFTAIGANGTNSGSVGNATMHWVQVGNTVFVTASVTNGCTTAGNTNTEFTQTLPVTPASNFAADTDVDGVCTIQPTTGVPYTAGFVYAVSGAKTVRCNYSCANNAAGRTVKMVFSYSTN